MNHFKKYLALATLASVISAGSAVTSMASPKVTKNTAAWVEEAKEQAEAERAAEEAKAAEEAAAAAAAVEQAPAGRGLRPLVCRRTLCLGRHGSAYRCGLLGLYGLHPSQCGRCLDQPQLRGAGRRRQNRLGGEHAAGRPPLLREGRRCQSCRDVHRKRTGCSCIFLKDRHHRFGMELQNAGSYCELPRLIWQLSRKN